MADTKRISKRTHTSVRLKRTETPAAPVPGAEQPRAPRRRHKARTGRVEAMRAMLNQPGFDLDAAFNKAIRAMIESELG